MITDLFLTKEHDVSEGDGFGIAFSQDNLLNILCRSNEQTKAQILLQNRS